MNFKVGDIVRHVHESDLWVWKVIQNRRIDNLIQVQLVKDVVGESSYRQYYKGHREYLVKSMTVLHPLYLKPKKNYQPSWL